MHLVVDHVAELDHVDDTHGCRLVEPVSCSTIPEVGLAIHRHACLLGIFTDVLDGCTVEDRSAELNSEFLSCPTEHGLVNLTEVHSGRHAERVEDDVHWSSVLEERHILPAHDLRYDTLVTMASGHLVTDSDLSLLCDIDFGKLHHSVRKIVSDLDLVALSLAFRCQSLVGEAIVVDEFLDQSVGLFVTGPFSCVDIEIVDASELVNGELLAFGYDFNVVQVDDSCALLALGEDSELVDESVEEKSGLLPPELLRDGLPAQSLQISCCSPLLPWHRERS